MDDLSTNLTLPCEYDGDYTPGETYLHLLAKEGNVKEFNQFMKVEPYVNKVTI